MSENHVRTEVVLNDVKETYLDEFAICQSDLAKQIEKNG